MSFWLVAKLMSAIGMVWGFAMRGRWPRFSGAIRRGFWIMVLFGTAVTVPQSLSASLLFVNLLLLGLGVSFYSADFSESIRRYGRVQTWAALLCLADFFLLWSSGLLEHPQVLGYAAARSALMAVCLQLFVVGIGVWLSIMLPLISEMRRARE
jgi:hypothetical protein